MGALGSIISAGAAKAEGDLSWSRTKRMMQQRHQWEVSDLRKAGLNPILSAGGAPSMGSPPNTNMQALGSTINQGRLMKSQIALNIAGAAKATADGALSDAKRGVIKPAATIGETVGGALEAASGAAKSLFEGFTGPQSGGPARIKGIPKGPKWGTNIRRRKGETAWQFTKRKFLYLKARRSNKMVEGDPSTY